MTKRMSQRLRTFHELEKVKVTQGFVLQQGVIQEKSDSDSGGGDADGCRMDCWVPRIGIFAFDRIELASELRFRRRPWRNPMSNGWDQERGGDGFPDLPATLRSRPAPAPTRKNQRHRAGVPSRRPESTSLGAAEREQVLWEATGKRGVSGF